MRLGSNKPHLALACIAGIILTVFTLYWPSLEGPFMFDDWVNLGVIGNHQQLPIAKQIAIFVTREGTSLIDRPISRLSFYLNDNAWPSNPEGFRYTNIGIHAINAILVFWLSLRLLTLVSNETERKSNIVIAALVATAWAIHPIHVNTTAYIIQRMTLLSGTFVLGGVIIYTYGREIVNRNKKKGIILLSLSILLFLPLAFLSKQNGILLPLFIAATEFTLLQHLVGARIIKRWSLLFILTPIMFVIFLFSIKSNKYIFSWYDALPFSPTERLLTETRILFDYLVNILAPQARASSLFHDDYLVSTSILNPPITLISILALVAIVVLSIAKRKKWQLFTFATWWFLAGHLLESSIIGLELYYEHRNYIPSVGIIFSAIVGGSILLKKRRAIGILSCTCLVLLIAFVTYLNTTAWQSREILAANWYEENPDSLRTSNLMAGTLYNIGKYESARSVLEKAANAWPNSPEPPLYLLLLDCLRGKTTARSVEETLESIPQNYTHSNIAIDIIRKLQAPISDGMCPPLTLRDIDAILKHMLKNPIVDKHNKSRKWKQLTYSLYLERARNYASRRNLNKAMHFADLAYSVKPNPDILSQQATWLASAGLYKESTSVAKRALVLSRKQAVLDYINPHEKNLLDLISALEQRGN